MSQPSPCAPDRRRARSLLADEWAATAVEYALTASLVAVAIVAGIEAVSVSTDGLYATLEAIGRAIAAVLLR
ncbi:Flp family type IVb pilin [Benzoatithermus flavus]|uniref:Flp family type IVb pilin n=1 Tax=Benzoatithermus flavus TaxID=3108223 RepID=A0ABU8XQY9_9PROT